MLIPCPSCQGAPLKRGRCLTCRFSGRVFVGDDIPAPPLDPPASARARSEGSRAKLTRKDGKVELTARVFGIDVQADVSDLLGELGEWLDD